MSFRRRTNRHKAWTKYCEAFAPKFAEIGLPPEVYSSENSFTEFLTTGRREELALDLDALSGEQFEKLVHFVTSWFDYDAADFLAFERRRLLGHWQPAAE